MSRLLVLLLSIAVLVAQTAFAAADETSEVSTGIVVEDAVLEPARKGENARLRFKVSNYTTRRVGLRAIRAPISHSASITMNLNAEGFEPVEQVYILREETLDLQSSHIRVELRDLREEARPGMKVEFELVFSDGATSAIADVH